MAEITFSTCTTCDGDGIVDDEICPDCVGGGSLPVVGSALFLKNTFSTLVTKCNTIISKCNEIISKCDEILGG